jgi:hypothetical protein
MDLLESIARHPWSSVQQARERLETETAHPGGIHARAPRREVPTEVRLNAANSRLLPGRVQGCLVSAVRLAVLVAVLDG